MPDRQIRAGIVLTGDATGAVQAFAQIKRETVTLRKQFELAQEEVKRLALALKEGSDDKGEFRRLKADFEAARSTARSLKEQIQAKAVQLQGARQAMAQYGVSTKALNDDLSRLKGTLSQTANLTKENEAGFNALGGDSVAKAGSRIRDLASSIAGLASLNAIRTFVRDSINEFRKMESAIRGLESVANFSGVGLGRAMDEASKLASDGLLTVAESSKALQNLLSRGFSLDQAIRTINSLKDAAAFNRQASLEMGEAVVSATEGLKNENSVLVDNAGVTKNVSVMWQEYARSVGKSVDELTQAEKVQAEVSGILRETAAQAGNASKAAEGITGQIARFNAASLQFKASLGETMLPAAIALLEAGRGLVDNFLKPLVVFTQSAGIVVGQLTISFQRFLELLKDRDFAAFREAVSRDTQLAESMFAEMSKRLSERPSLTIEPTADPVDVLERRILSEKALLTQFEQDKGRIALDGTEAIRKSDDELARSRVRNQERIVEAIRESFRKQIELVARFAAEAERLRAKAAAVAAGSERKLDDPGAVVSVQQSERRKRDEAKSLPPDEQARRQREIEQADRDRRERDDAREVRINELTRLADLSTSTSITQRTQGRTEEAAESAKEALETLKQARKVADSLESKDRKDLFSADIDKLESGVLAEQSKQAEKLGQEAQQVADAQARLLSSLEEQLAKLRTAADQVKLDLQIDAQIKKVAELEAALAKARFAAGTGPGFTNTPGPQADGSFNLYNLPGYASGGPILGPGGPTDDQVPFWGSNGEFVQRAEAVRFYGVDFMKALNELRIPRFANGGLIGAIPELASGSRMQPIQLTVPSVGTFPVSASFDVAASIQEAFSRASRKRGRRI